MQILVFALSVATLLIGVLGDEARHGRDAAMAADQAKTRFLTRIGHELRTPLNGVIGAGDLLAREMDGADAKLHDRLDLIRSSARTLASVVEDLVEYAALHREGISVRHAPFLAAQPFRDAAAIFGPRARWNGVDLSLHLTGFDDLHLKGDAARWRQVFFNLVANAVESTQRGEISIEAHAHRKPGGGILVEAVVRDTGLGIPADRLPQIFEPFMQGQDAKGRPVPGLGLGLAVVKETLSALGGSVRVESAPGRGSAFFVSLPADEANAARTFNTQGKARALLADDNPTNRVLLSAQLSGLGFDVVTVETGAEALAAAEKEDFSLIMMDIQMPVMDGEEAIERIRQIEGHRGRTPILVVTAHALPGDDVRFKASGADGFLAKPVEQVALAEAVSRVLT
jgi:CheY-like chemotaxis protein